MGKGSKKRLCLVSRTEESLRWRLFQGRITREYFDRMMAILKKGEPIYKACEYKGTFSGCGPLICLECKEQEDAKK